MVPLLWLVETNRTMYILTFKGQLQNLTSGQGNERSRGDQVGHVAYYLMRLDRLPGPARVSIKKETVANDNHDVY